MIDLAPCRACQRHVRVGAACPFCGAPSPERRAVARPRAPGRFALLFAGSIGLASCGEEPSPGVVEPTPVAPEPVVPEPIAAPGPSMQPIEPIEALPEPEPVEPEPVIAEPSEPSRPRRDRRPAERPVERPVAPPIAAYGGPPVPMYGGPGLDF